MIASARNYFSGISRGVEGSKYTSVILTKFGSPEFLNPDYYELFKDTEENLIGGCWKDDCVKKFFGKLEDIAPGRSRIIDKWTCEYAKTVGKNYIDGEI